jgi:iron uptake system component EfeO
MPRLLPAVVVAVALVLTACGSHGHSTPQGSSDRVPHVVGVSVSDCGSDWKPVAAGTQDFVLHNTDQSPGEVQVVGVGKTAGLVYADVEPFGPGTTVDVRVPLAAGSYALACLMEDQAPVVGPTRTLEGSQPGAPGVRIVTQSQLVPAAQAYQRWVRRHLPPLRHDTARLRALVDRGLRTAARAAWLRAHLDYQRLGAAYDAFGDLGDAIDGLPAGLPGGTHSAHWSGFHRVELDLWSTVPAPRLRADVATLTRAVDRLPHLLASTQLDPLTLTLRAHEIAENALEVQLTGKDDFGSHTDLDSVRAELAGTGAVLRALAGPIDRRVAHSRQIRTAWRQSLAAFGRASRSRPRLPVARLPRLERERLAASLGLLTQRLAAVPATLEPRVTVASGSIDQGDG